MSRFSMPTFELDSKRRALLDVLLQEEGFKSLLIPKITRRKGGGSPPLSFAQEQLWFMDQLEPGNPFYNLPTGVRLSGPLNVAALEQSLNEILRRHEALRTTFVTVDGNPVQVIAPALTIKLPVVDLSALPETERESLARQMTTERARGSFNLAEGPLLRATLLRLAEEEHIFLLTIHHIVTDGWSMGVFFRELSALYEAFYARKLFSLPELPVQYADFAYWQHEWLQGEILEQQLSYWKQQLAGIPTLLALPTDRLRLPVQSFRGASQSVVLPKRLTEELKTLSRQEGATLFMTLLAAFQTLLSRLTGQEDIVVGSPIAGRNRPEVEGLIGLFINTLVLRTDLSGNPTFRKLLGRVREVALGAYAHQDIPFEKLLGELQLERSLSRNTLFQVMLVLNQPTLERNLNLPGLNSSKVPIGMGVAKFDLILFIVDGGESLRCSFTYNTDLFDATTIARMVRHFQTLLESIVANPDEGLSDLPLLIDTERKQLLVDWNNTTTANAKNKCIHELFEAQVKRAPDAIAVLFEAAQLTYREVNQRANQLAHYLKNHGVGPEVLVGICMERSLEMVVGLLGILKAGGAYVPLDPNYPKEGLASTLEDAQVSVLLTQQRLVEYLPKPDAKVICLDSGWEVISQESGEDPVEEAIADNLAYVIYTSGSTGRPKGVEITHKALVNFTTSACTGFGLEPSDRVLQFASISFDTAVEEIFPCLIRGATLVLRTYSMLDSVSLFLQKCRDWGITVLDLPTVYWHELTEQVCSEQLTIPAQLRLVIIGGERAVPGRLAQWQKCSGGHVRLLNTYGPTEVTVVATTWELAGSAEVDTSMREVPIGRPIPNVQTYVLDGYLNPVPIGVYGELHIGGMGLARGYLNRPDLTTEKFIPNPLSDEPGNRLYKTGDLARYLPDGTLEFLGRMDHQVKVRGFRIELGEVEAVLGQHPGVRDTAVMAREDELGNNKLVAYVVPSQEQVPTVSELRIFLKAKLPEHMLPSAFVFLDALHLTPNGKVDRRALPAPDQSMPELEGAFVAPRTPTEEILARIWSQLLGLKQVGIHDNFFHLGGHSLLAVRLFAEIEKEFKKHLPLSTLFQSATIEHLANLVSQRTRTTPSSLVAIRSEGSKLPFFCVHEFFGDVLCYMNLSRQLGDDQPFYALQALGLNNGDEPLDDIRMMAAYYIEQIRTVQPQGPYALGGLCIGGLIAFEMAQQLRAQGEAVALVALFDSVVKSNADKPSWWRFFEAISVETPSWLAGALQLNGSQWRDLIKLKRMMLTAKLAHTFGLSDSSSGQKTGSKLINEMADLWGFSEQHRKVAHAQREALKKYRPQPYPGRLTLFKPQMQPLFSSHTRDKGWGRFAAGGLEIKVVPANHLGMLQEPHVKTLAKELGACLDKANRS